MMMKLMMNKLVYRLAVRVRVIVDDALFRERLLRR